MTSSEQTNLDAQCTYPLPPMHFWLVKVKYFKDFPLLVSIWIQMEILARDEKSKETAQDYGFLCPNCRTICFLWNNHKPKTRISCKATLSSSLRRYCQTHKICTTYNVRYWRIKSLYLRVVNICSPKLSLFLQWVFFG